jgi:hypothetical protein
VTFSFHNYVNDTFVTISSKNMLMAQAAPRMLLTAKMV